MISDFEKNCTGRGEFCFGCVPVAMSVIRLTLRSLFDSSFFLEYLNF